MELPRVARLEHLIRTSKVEDGSTAKEVVFKTCSATVSPTQ